MLEPSSSEDEGGDEGTVEDVSEPPTVRFNYGGTDSSSSRVED